MIIVENGRRTRLHAGDEVTWTLSRRGITARTRAGMAMSWDNSINEFFGHCYTVAEFENMVNFAAHAANLRIQLVENSPEKTTFRFIACA
ncbi:MAG: hypothetical protein A3F53_00410 [Candidatus Zambryskibacteria bacterium RIFCSPHIGHO2_12_FULL_48_10]|nr:MAG: hypothetical protein A3F53_00410 [Candidatus Zambryskibacteria bacterium RIFCSPHIGHO2_12_FULL_48_10]OHB07140.1 MAG: hypothetical protein A3A31_00220 [Candidatus Zambryskibacteria bacterium RIFCSPLOWO2_01_FULL_48_25]